MDRTAVPEMEKRGVMIAAICRFESFNEINIIDNYFVNDE